MVTKPRALILDFGGVITRTLFETHDMSEQALGLPRGTLSWRGPFQPQGDALWQRMQNREISERDYWTIRAREVGRLVGEEWSDMKSFVQRARGADPDLIIRPQAREAIWAARAAGIRLAILSNELDLFYGAQIRQQLDLLSLFEVIVDATYTGVLKPDLRAFETVLAHLDMPPSQCVFVDDQKKNIEGAAAIGLPFVHFDVTRPGESYTLVFNRLGLDKIFEN